jgi:hypothetical protein
LDPTENFLASLLNNNEVTIVASNCSIGLHQSTSHPANNPGYMQLELHLKETCDWNRTYNRDAIGITPTRMPLELHLQETCNQDNTYRSHAIGIALQLIAATACSIFGQPSHKYLNAITIASTHAITDTGATSIFIMDGVNVINKRITNKTLTINMPDRRKVKSTHICDIMIPGLPMVLMGHVILHLAIASLIGIWLICNAGCTLIFHKDKCDVIYNGNVILQGFKDIATNLWTLPINGLDMQIALPQSAPQFDCALHDSLA